MRLRTFFVRILLALMLLTVILTLLISKKPWLIKRNNRPLESTQEGGFKNITPSSSPASTPSPTPKPLSFAEMNEKYGPCTFAPVLMYHHIQDSETAKLNKQSNLSINPEVFRSHLQYLRDKGYSILKMQDIIDFFNNGKALPPKSVLLTFDDGYQDFYSQVLPLLREFNAPANIFLITGLMNNPGYLTWDEINNANGSGLVFVGNHTWSHRSTSANKETVEREISTADTQLNEKGLNSLRVFAYPYGFPSATAENYLGSLNYNLAFTTSGGGVLCQRQRLFLPRIRIGNASLSAYGF